VQVHVLVICTFQPSRGSPRNRDLNFAALRFAYSTPKVDKIAALFRVDNGMNSM
jgi:hypothetical protein